MRDQGKVTERVVVLMSAAEKTRLSGRAEVAGLSLSAYIRGLIIVEDEALTSLVAELRASTATARLVVDDVIERMDARERQAAAREAQARTNAQREFAMLRLKRP